MFKEYLNIRDIIGPLILLQEVEGVSYGELAEIKLTSGEMRRGRVLEIADRNALIQVFEGTQGIARGNVKVKFLGKGMEIGVSPDIMGRIFNGAGETIDEGPPIIPTKFLNINGNPINPCARDYPKEFIQTGISSLDSMNSLVRGQKLPIFFRCRASPCKDCRSDSTSGQGASSRGKICRGLRSHGSNL